MQSSSKKKTCKKTSLSLEDRVFMYAFRDFKDIRLSAHVNDCNEFINTYNLYLPIPGWNWMRGVKAMTSHLSASDESSKHMLEHFDELFLAFPEDIHEALKKKMTRECNHWCPVSKNDWHWKELRECIGKRFLDMLEQHGSLKVFCWVSGEQTTCIDVKSYEELMLKIDMWESLER